MHIYTQAHIQQKKKTIYYSVELGDFPLKVGFVRVSKLSRCHIIDVNQEERILSLIYFKKQRLAELYNAKWEEKSPKYVKF